MSQIFAIVGPSGVGKDTLIAGAMAQCPDLHLVRRVITRPEAAGGEPFEGVTPAEFARRKAAGDFALDWEAHGLHYGLPQEAFRVAGDVMFNGSREALTRAQQVFAGLVVIMITAPDAVLAQRLAQRGRETAEQITARLGRATFDLPPGVVPRVVVNDQTPDVGVDRLLAALYPSRG